MLLALTNGLENEMVAVAGDGLHRIGVVPLGLAGRALVAVRPSGGFYFWRGTGSRKTRSWTSPSIYWVHSSLTNFTGRGFTRIKNGSLGIHEINRDVMRET